MNPSYPVYIISKGRWKLRPTSRLLEAINVPYHIVVEPQEYDEYAKVIDERKILVLPFSNLGQGSIPARNWVWEHAENSGVARHWILDDNIRQLYRVTAGHKYTVTSGTIFKAAEDFVERYKNVALAGFQDIAFLASGARHPFSLNTRIYSCILIKNDIPYRWRGRYNEDTDLSLRALKDGWCTMLFYAFVMDKATTMTMRGGNTDELYQDDGRLRMAQSLRAQLPDVTTIRWKWGRWQHHVDYSRFKSNRLVLRDGVQVARGVENYGMKLVSNESP